MKEWRKPELEILNVKCTEHGDKITPWEDEVRPDNVNPGDINWFSFSGPGVDD